MGHKQSRPQRSNSISTTSSSSSSSSSSTRSRRPSLAFLDEALDRDIATNTTTVASSLPPGLVEDDDEYQIIGAELDDMMIEKMDLEKRRNSSSSSSEMLLTLQNPFPVSLMNGSASQGGGGMSTASPTLPTATHTVTSIASTVKALLSHRGTSQGSVILGLISGSTSSSSSSTSEGDLLKASGTDLSTVRDEDQAEFFYDCGKRLLLGKEGGMEIARDAPRAVCLLLRAAELGHRGAQWDLQCCNGTGDDIKLDYDKAVALYKRHAQHKDPIALSNLGVCYHKGRGVPLSLSKAAKYYKRAAELNYSRGNYNLGVCYDLGEGVEQSVTKAVEHYSRAAQLGYAVAQYYMGVCYQHSKGLPAADLRKAIDLWRKAALQGHALAQAMLGSCFKDGNGVEKDILMSAHLFLAATAWGDAKAWTRLKDALANEAFEECKQDTEKYQVPTLYDQCCMHFHRKWSSYEMDAEMPVLQSKLPMEITERIKYQVNKCIHPACHRVFYGSGRLERRFRLKPTHIHKVPSACAAYSVRHENDDCANNTAAKCDGECAWDTEKDIVLSFCSIHCSQLA